MDINISAKHIEVEEAVKEKARELGEKLAADYPAQKISSIRVLFAEERNWQIAEVLVNAKFLTLHAAAKLDDMGASLASAFEKIHTQMVRYLGKVRDCSVKPDPVLKDKIWKATDLREAADDADLDGYEYEYDE